MAIYTIAQYQVRSSGIEKVKRAIEEFVPYVTHHEPGSRIYAAWQQQDDPTRFAHVFIFQDEAANEAHGRSDAVKRFEEAYRPELVGGDVVFTDYNQIATNRPEVERIDARDQQKAAVREFTRIFKNEHNVDGIDHLFAPDFTHHFRAPVAPGLEGFKQIGRGMNTAFPDVKVTEQSLLADDNIVVERTTAAGTHKGNMMGAAPTNRPCSWSEIHMYRFNASNKIVEHWVEMSMLELLKQVGAVTP
jgi:predicted ester cyclase/quinol monooxygenase YgiN